MHVLKQMILTHDDDFLIFSPFSCFRNHTLSSSHLYHWAWTGSPRFPTVCVRECFFATLVYIGPSCTRIQILCKPWLSKPHSFALTLLLCHLTTEKALFYWPGSRKGISVKSKLPVFQAFLSYRRAAQCLVTFCIRLTIGIWAQGDHNPVKNGELIVNV